jgi:hypothetical protein
MLKIRAVEGLDMLGASLPDPPPPGSTITDLSADVSSTGDVTVSGTLQTSGPGSVRSISARNITVSGTLKSGPGSGAVQSLAIEASGSVYITGTIDASGAPGQGGGNISIVAATAIVLSPSGAILAAGGQGGGAGGAITMEQASSFLLEGQIDARGGSGPSGGHGGSLSVGVSMGANQVHLGWGAILARGGDGGAQGGAGGTLDVSSFRGGTSISGAWDASGGASGSKGGPGGTIQAEADIGGGDLTVDASLVSRGGDGQSTGGSARGGTGGTIQLFAFFDKTISAGSGGSVLLQPATVLNLDGGSSSGTSDAGGGGTVFIEIPEEKVILAGHMTARGGSANGSGRGGLGGFFYVASDTNQTGTGGDTTLQKGAVIDVSGGGSAGGQGGDAQWSPQAGIFDPFVIPIAVLFDAGTHPADPVKDANFGPEGWIENDGQIIAQGGHPNGHGGDVEFHGRGSFFNPTDHSGMFDPARGDVENQGDGTGADGVWTSN